MESANLVDRPEIAHAALSPLRLEILRHLDEPASASALAKLLELPRQKLNYHMRILERCGLIELADEVQRRGFVERRFRRVGDVVLAPDLVSPSTSVSPRQAASAQAAIAAATDIIRTVGSLIGTDRPLVTTTLTADVTFASPADLRAFLEGVADLAARFDRGSSAGHTQRITLVTYPGRQQ